MSRNSTRVYYQEKTESSRLMRQYHKIPKVSPGAYTFHRPFLRGLVLEGLLFAGAYFGNFTIL